MDDSPFEPRARRKVENKSHPLPPTAATKSRRKSPPLAEVTGTRPEPKRTQWRAQARNRTQLSFVNRSQPRRPAPSRITCTLIPLILLVFCVIRRPCSTRPTDLARPELLAPIGDIPSTPA
ncbi:methionine synthase 2 [Striga asiatica]|uniref:Methionine synthase 2 n=1 Tax=Striga asiatica TaxID=4170 RepID=A0A5A7QIT4_STRAF|nr:methionine synthase 2 [Striga asiatica]